MDNEIIDINWSEPFEVTAQNIKIEDATSIPEDCFKCLQESFGHSSFRKMQWKVISSILDNSRDNCVIMATGYGKSLCFQFPSVYRNTITIVVSPLISLMQDQVTAMSINNLKSCFLGSAQTNRDTIYEVIDRQYNIVYVTPEYITSEAGLFLIEKIRDDLTLIAIDEAHCISKWGHDFRSAYRKLSCLRTWCPSVPILAMTATATTKVRDDIINNLHLRNPQIIATGFDRPNLEFIVKPKTEVWDDIGEHIKNVKIGSIIVYCIARKVTHEVADIISAHGYLCGVYHAGLPHKQRLKTHDDFIHDRIRVVVATIAFGMGINKPDVRLVIHYGVSKDIEGYYQEVGRAGRDGLPAKCLLFHRPKDWALHRMIRQNSNVNTSVEQMEKLMKAIRDYVDTKDCRRRFIMSYFEEDCKNLLPRSDCCDNCNRALAGPMQSINLYSKYQGLDMDGQLDITEDAIVLLNLLRDPKFRYGIRKAILVLRGSKSKDVPAAFTNHSSFGKLKHRSEKWIQAVANSLIEMSMLTTEDILLAHYSYTRCIVTTKSKVWLSGLVQQDPIKVMPNDEFIKLLNPRVVSAPRIVLPIFENKSDNRPSTSAGSSVAASSTILLNNTTLSSPSTKSDIIRPLLKVRSKLASLYDVMPYLVASTKALEQLAKIRPTTMEELRNIRLDGYSEEKIQRFGPVFIKVIKDYISKFSKTANTENTSGEQHQMSLERVKLESNIDASNNNNPTPNSNGNDKSLNNDIQSNRENSPQIANQKRSPPSSQDSLKIIEPPQPPTIEIDSDVENAIFDNWDSDDSELTHVGEGIEQELNASVINECKSENPDLDLFIHALETDEKLSKKENQSRFINKKPTNALEYDSDSGSEIFDAEWDLEIDESDLTQISQQAEENFKCNAASVTESTSASSSSDFIELKTNCVDIKTEDQDNIQIKTEINKRKPRIIERKVKNAFEYEDDSESDTETMVSPKKRVMPSWMQLAQKRKK